MTGVGYPIEYNYLKYLPNLIFLPRKGLNYAILAVMVFFFNFKSGHCGHYNNIFSLSYI